MNIHIDPEFRYLSSYKRLMTHKKISLRVSYVNILQYLNGLYLKFIECHNNS